MPVLPAEFLERMERMLGDEFSVFLESYNEPPVRGLRVNTLKISPEAFLHIAPFALTPVGHLAEGFILEGEARGIGAHPYHAAGLYYMQEPSAMQAVAALQIEPGMAVLDLCAAPGGKSSGIASRLQGKGLLVSNEIELNRAKTLQFNLERMGVTNAVVTSAHPNSLCSALQGFFDAVLVDAPCSGEGMFRKDEGAVKEWSNAHVLACAARQSAILKSAAIAVKQGGALVYSTCTFSKEENEEVVEGFLKEHANFELASMQRFYPHTMRGEGHFVARLVKKGGGIQKQKPLALKPCKDIAFTRFMEESFQTAPAFKAYMLEDGRVFLLGTEIPSGLSSVRVLSAGVLAGELKKNRFEPSHALFLGSHGGKFRHTMDLACGDARLNAFLSGHMLEVDESLKGYCAVAVNGHILGFGKASGGMLKNHYPKALRTFSAPS